jgi:hypothetical protein
VTLTFAAAACFIVVVVVVVVVVLLLLLLLLMLYELSVQDVAPRHFAAFSTVLNLTLYEALTL